MNTLIFRLGTYTVRCRAGHTYEQRIGKRDRVFRICGVCGKPAKFTLVRAKHDDAYPHDCRVCINDLRPAGDATLADEHVVDVKELRGQS